jgi:DNA-binding transcriptional MerR regulator
MMRGLRSGEVAAAVGVNLQTLRYYERRGLLAEPERTPQTSSSRRTSPDDADRQQRGRAAVGDDPKGSSP